MMIKLKTLVEQIGSEGQFYDVGHDFAAFKSELDGTIEKLKQKFQTVINEKISGKRILAKASRGFKQYVKQYEFDVSKITIEDYYDTYVVIAHDMHTAKPKEYFLDTKSQIKIIGPATGQPSPQKGVNPAQVKKQPTHQVTEEEAPANNKQYAAYSIDDIVEDIAPWLPLILKNSKTPMVDFVKKIGWTAQKEGGVIISVFEIRVPISSLKYAVPTAPHLEKYIFNKTKHTLRILSVETDKSKDECVIKIKKVYRK